MKKSILILSTSPRPGGNSDLLADAFLQGTQEAGHEAEKISLHGKALGFCRGCLACQKTGRCVIDDDASAITRRMKSADVLVFATPVYYYSMCGQMKTLLDRANPLFSSEYAFRDVYLLATAAEDDPDAVDGTVQGMEGWIACFEKARLRGTVRGVGVTAPGDILRRPAFLDEAFRLGRNA